MSGPGKDIDIMVDGLSGKKFAEYVSEYLKDVKKEPEKNVGVIQARPEQSKNLETAVLSVYGQSIDFVSPRKEVYTDATRIPEVKSATPEEDAERRDFNFNSLFLDLDTNEIKDFTGKGIEDIKNKVVRTPLDPKITFSDDPLRILRAIRFATRFNFTLDPELIKAAKDSAIKDAFAKKISRERIHDEFRKMLTGPNPVEAMKLLTEIGLRDEVLKLPKNFEAWEMDQKSPHHDYTVYGHTLQVLTNLQEIIKNRSLNESEKFIVNLAALLHDVGKLNPASRQIKQVEDKIIRTYHGHEVESAKASEFILRNLPGAKVEEIEAIKKLIIGASKVNPDRRPTEEEYDRPRKALAKFVREMGSLYDHAISLAHADTSGHKINQFSTHPTKYYDTMREKIKAFDPNSIIQMKPLLNGNELMALFNKKGGQWISILIKELIDLQLENPALTKEQAIEFVKKIYEERGLDKHASISKRAMARNWWLSPDNKLYIFDEEHVEFVLHHPELFGRQSDYTNGFSIKSDVFGKGWMRGGFGFIQIPSFNDKYLHKIQEILPDITMPIYNDIYIEDESMNNGFSTSYSDIVSAKSFKDIKGIDKTAFTGISCSCGRKYSGKDFLALTFKNNMYPGINPKDDCIKCYEHFDSIMRDCHCGETIMLKTSCIHKPLSKRAKEESDFPKVCAVCNRKYKDIDDFLTLRLPLGKKPRPILLSNDPGLQCGYEWGDDYDLVYRNCECDSTLAVKIPCRHKKLLTAYISKRAKEDDEKQKPIQYDIPKLISLSNKLPVIKVKVISLMSNPNNRVGLENLALESTKNMMEHDRVHVVKFDDPIVIKEDGTIIDGFHRVLKAIMIGVEFIDVKMIPDEMLKEELAPEDQADDEANKYEREKNDKKWNEILIDKDGVKLTRKQIRDHYIKNADKIMKEIRDKPVMIYIGTDKNKNILKRNHNDRPIIITNADKDKSGDADNLIYWADRLLLSLHFVMGPKTKLGWIDLDLHNFDKKKALEYAKKVSPVVEKEIGGKTQIFESGGTGYHIEINLSKEMGIDELREKLRALLDEFNKGWENVSTGIIKGSGMRSDISTLKNLGSIRVPHSLGETYGKEKKPLLSSRE